jgi:hypothetical protein
MGGPALSQKSGYAGQPLPQGEILTTKRALQQRKTPDWQHDRKIDMLNAETLAITYGIGSALAWGAGDFSGGFATKRGSVFTVILYSQIIGGLLLVGLQVVWGEPLVLQNIIGDHHALDFRCALVNGEHPGVTVKPLHRVVGGENRIRRASAGPWP